MNANEKRTYGIEELSKLGYEIVRHMWACGTVTDAVWYAYQTTPNAVRRAEMFRANPKLF